RTRWPFRPRWPAMATPPLPAPMMHTDSLGRKKDILTPPWLPTPPGWPQKSHRGSCGGLRKHAEIPSRFPTTLARLADGFGPSGWPYPAGEAARIHPGKLGPPLRAQARIQRTSMPVKVSGIVGASLFYVNGRILTTPGKAWKFVALGGGPGGVPTGDARSGPPGLRSLVREPLRPPWLHGSRYAPVGTPPGPPYGLDPGLSPGHGSGPAGPRRLLREPLRPPWLHGSRCAPVGTPSGPPYGHDLGLSPGHGSGPAGPRRLVREPLRPPWLHGSRYAPVGTPPGPPY